MRNLSFSATTEQVRQRRKFVSRRGNKKGPAWKNLKPNEHLMGVEKCQGLKKGEHVKQLEEIVTLDAAPERLDEIIQRPVRKVPDGVFLHACKCCRFAHYHPNTDEWSCGSGAKLGFSCGINECPGIHEVDLEGFPEMTPEEFVELFCEMNGCQPDTVITRILFDYVGDL